MTTMNTVIPMTGSVATDDPVFAIGPRRRRLSRLIAVVALFPFIFDAAQAEMKWNPGHYMQIGRGNADTVQPQRFVYYDDIATNTNIVGVVVPFRWNMLEGAQGDYSAGIATIRAEIAKLKSLSSPKRLYVRIIDNGFNQPASDIFPSYLIETGATFETNTSSIWRKWNANYMDAYIAMVTAYAVEFDDEPYFEGLYLIRETALGWGGSQPPPDYDNTAYVTQLQRLALEAKTAWTKTNVIMPTNFIGGQSVMDSHIAYLASIGVGIGGPDVLPPPSVGTHAYKTLTGDSGGHDYRGEIPVQYSIEASELGGSLGSWMPSDLYDFANGTLQTSHLFWQRNYSTGQTEQQWPAIMEFIADNPLTYTAPPAVYDMTPSAPTNLSATVVGSSQIDLAWTDRAFSETGFEIDRATDSSFTTGLVTSTVGANATSFNSTGLAANTTYFHRVRAINAYGASAAANTVTATTPLIVGFENAVIDAHSDPYTIRASPSDVLFKADADGDYITIRLPNLAAGTYEISVRVQKGPNRGTFQLEGATSLGGPYTPHGAAQDTYASNYLSQTLAVASNVTFANSGTRYFRFRVTGKNGSSSGRYLALDEMTLKR